MLRPRQFVPVTEANLTLSFDHRVLDGGAAGRLLSRVASLLQTPENCKRKRPANDFRRAHVCQRRGGQGAGTRDVGRLRVVQIFVKNNMQWFGRPHPPADIARFQGGSSPLQFAAVFGHTGYLINLGAGPAAIAPNPCNR